MDLERRAQSSSEFPLNYYRFLAVNMCKEYSPGFARLHDLSRSCVRWEETSIRHHSRKRRSPRVQWSNPWQEKIDNLLSFIYDTGCVFSSVSPHNLNFKAQHSLCYYPAKVSCKGSEIILFYLPTQIPKADVEFVLLTGLLLFTGVIIWKWTSLITTKKECFFTSRCSRTVGR